MNSSRPRRRAGLRPALVACLLAVATAGCHGTGSPTGATSSSGNRDLTSQTTAGGLVQTVTVSRNPVTEGEDLVITAVLRNGTSKAVRVYAGYGCRLDVLQTDLRFDTAECMVATGPVELAPGDSVVSTRGGAVVSPAGTYSVRVRQAYDTELWAAISVDVRAK